VPKFVLHVTIVLLSLQATLGLLPSKLYKRTLMCGWESELSAYLKQIMRTEYNRNDITLIIIFSTKIPWCPSSSTVVVAKRVRKCLGNKGEICSTYLARADLSRRRLLGCVAFRRK